MKKNSGFSLVEVTLALAVASYCLVAVFGLMPIGVSVNHQAVEQTAATAILSAVATDLRSTPPTVPLGQATTTQQFGVEIPSNPIASTTTSSRVVDSRYRLTVTFLPNPDPRGFTMANVKVSWPAEVTDPTLAAGSVQTLVALDRN